MGQDSKIEWTDHTFNPWWGCVEVSPACDHCYARTFAKRTGNDVWGKNSTRRFFGDKHWAEPIKWNLAAAKSGVRKRVFCASMADVMEDREDLQHSRVRLYNLIDDTQWLDWLLLTKRPQNFKRFLPAYWLKEPRPNVWLMTTVETQEYIWRAQALIETPASIRGLSVEPLLGPLDLGAVLGLGLTDSMEIDNPSYVGMEWPVSRGIDWVIAGGESGAGARPMHLEWVRSLRDQCIAAQVPFHFKQFGHYNERGIGVGKNMAGRILDGRTWDEFPPGV